VNQPFFDAHAPWDGKAASQSQVIRRLPALGVANCKHECAVEPRCMGLTYFSAPTWFDTAGIDGVLDPLPSFYIENQRAQDYERGDCTLFSQPLSSDNWLDIEEPCAGASPPVHLNVGVGPERLTDGLYQPLATGTGDFLGHHIYQACPGVDEVVVPLVARSRVHAVRVWRRCDDLAESQATALQVSYGVPVSGAADSNAALSWTACGGPSTLTEHQCVAGAAPAEQFWERQCNGDMTAATMIRISRAVYRGISLTDSHASLR
jgi:hypothetical protein